MASQSGGSRWNNKILLVSALLLVLLVPPARGQEAPPVEPSPPAPRAPGEVPGVPPRLPEPAEALPPTLPFRPEIQIQPLPIPSPFAPPVPSLPPVPGEPPPLRSATPVRSIGPGPAFISAVEDVGRFRAQLFLSVDEEFSDNVNQSKTNRESEFRTTISPGLLLGFDTPRASLNLAFSLGASFPDGRLKDTTADLTSSLSLRTGLDLTPLIRLGLADELTRSDDFRDLGDITSRRTGRQEFLSNVASVDLSYSPPRARTFLTYANSLAIDLTSGGDTSLTQSGSTGIDLINPNFGLGGSYTLTVGDFSESTSSYFSHTAEVHASRSFTPTFTGTASTYLNYYTPDVGEEYATYGGNVGGNWTLSPVSSLSVSVGVGVFAPRFLSNNIIPTSAISYTRRFSWIYLLAQYTHGFQTNLTALNNTGVSQVRQALITLTTSAFRNVSMGLTLRWAQNQFEQSTPGGVVAGTTDQTYDVEFSIGYSILRWLYLSAGYTFTLRDSTQPSAEFYENRVRLNLTATYDLLSLF